METEKNCARCAALKPLGQFFNSSRRADGKDYYCKACRNAVNKSNPKQREYNRAAGARWRAANPEKIKAKSKREYWNDREKNLARQAEWAKANPEKRSAAVRRHYRKYPERAAASHAKRWPAYYAANKAKITRNVIEWQRANPEKRREKARRYYEANAAEIAMRNRSYCINRDTATPHWANEFFMNEAYSLARLRTKLTGYKWVVDHIVPLNSKIVCGLHTHTNLQVVPHLVNAVKSNKRWPDMPEATNGD